MNERVGTTMERPARSRSSGSLFPRSATESGFERGQSPLAWASVLECSLSYPLPGGQEQRARCSSEGTTPRLGPWWSVRGAALRTARALVSVIPALLR
jgi:hypothetical protein